MRQNSIDYPGERAAKRSGIIKQAGYTGKNFYAVTYGSQKLIVRAADELAAMFTAAKHWGYAWTRPEYHQNARADKFPYTPGDRPGEVL